MVLFQITRRLFLLLLLLAISTAGYAVSGESHYTFNDGRTLTVRYGFSGGDIQLEKKNEDGSRAYYKGWIEKGSSFTASATISGVEGYSIRIGCKFYDKHRRMIDEKYEGGTNSFSYTFTMPEEAVEAECYIESAGVYTEIHYRVETESNKRTVDSDDDEEEEDDDEEDEEEEEEDWEEDNDAEEEAGIKDYIIPISIGILILGGGAVVANSKRKNKKKDKKKKDDDKKQPDQLRMEVNKDFGDMLIQGGDSEYVYACIIRHPSDGPEYVDEELTSRIQISAGDNYMAVEEQGVINYWKCAIVQAPENQDPPEEGIVKFRLASAEASYTNNIHFRIMKSGILFAQENLTLPARYEKEVRLPFVAVGMNDGSAKVKITITEEKGGAETKDYSVKVEWNATNKVYEAVIKDLCQNEKDDEGVPGNFIGYKINIEATNDKKRTVKGDLPLYPFVEEPETKEKKTLAQKIQTNEFYNVENQERISEHFLSKYLSKREVAYYMAQIRKEAQFHKDSYIQVIQVIQEKEKQKKFAEGTRQYKRNNLIDFALKENLKAFGWSINPPATRRERKCN